MKIKNSVIFGLALFSIIVLIIAISSTKFEAKAQAVKPIVGHIVLYEAGSTSGGSTPDSMVNYVWGGTKSFVENIFLPAASCTLRVKCCYITLQEAYYLFTSYNYFNEYIKNGGSSGGACIDGISTNLGDYEYKIDCTIDIKNDYKIIPKEGGFEATIHSVGYLNHVSVSYKC